MARRAVNMRLEEELLAWCDGYARQRGSNRTAVVEAGLQALREDARGGVPELDSPRAERIRRAEGAHEKMMRARQVALNRGSGR